MTIWRLLVRLYPRAWRDRYEEEFLAAAERTRPSVPMVLDALRGALDARVRTVSIRGPGEWLAVAAALWAAAAWPLFVLAVHCVSAGRIACPSVADALSDSGALVPKLAILWGIGLLPIWLRRSRGWLVAWAILAFLPSLLWDAEVWILPAVLMAVVAAGITKETSPQVQ